MVTIAEARKDLDTAKQELGIQQSLAKAKELEVQSVQLSQVPRRQLQTRGMMDMIKRKIMGQKLEQQKAESLGTLSSYQQQLKERGQSLSQYETELSAVEQQQAVAVKQKRDYEYGRKLGLRGVGVRGFNLSRAAQQGYQDAIEKVQYTQKTIKNVEALQREGITLPQFQAMTSEQLNTLSAQTISNLESAGLLTTTVPDVPVPTTTYSGQGYMEQGSGIRDTSIRTPGVGPVISQAPTSYLAGIWDKIKEIPVPLPSKSAKYGYTFPTLEQVPGKIDDIPTLKDIPIAMPSVNIGLYEQGKFQVPNKFKVDADLTTLGAVGSTVLKKGVVPAFEKVVVPTIIKAGDIKVPFTDTKIKDIPMAVPIKEGIAVAGREILSGTVLAPGRFVNGEWKKYSREELFTVIKDKPVGKITTLTGGLKAGEEAVSWIGRAAEAGWTGASFEGTPAGRPIPGGEFFGPIAKIAPETVLWLGAPVVAGTISMGAGIEELRPEWQNKEVDKLKIEGYNQYLKNIETGAIQFKEDERALTKKEFLTDTDIEKEYRSSLTSSAKLKLGIGGLVVAGSIIAGWYKYAKQPIKFKMGGRTKITQPFEWKHGSKKGYKQVIQTESGKEIIYPRWKVGLKKVIPDTWGLRLKPTSIKDIGGQKMIIKSTVGKVSSGKPFFLKVTKISKPPKELLAGDKLIPYIKTAKTTATAKIIKVIPKKVPKDLLSLTVKKEVFSKGFKGTGIFKDPKGFAKTSLAESMGQRRKITETILVSQEKLIITQAGKTIKFKIKSPFQTPKVDYLQTIEKKLIKIVPKKQLYTYETAGRRINPFTIKYKTGARVIKDRGLVEEFLIPKQPIVIKLEGGGIMNIFKTGKKGQVALNLFNAPVSKVLIPKVIPKTPSLINLQQTKTLVFPITKVTPKTVTTLPIINVKEPYSLFSLGGLAQDSQSKLLVKSMPKLIDKTDTVTDVTEKEIPKYITTPRSASKSVEVEKVSEKVITIPILKPIVIPKSVVTTKTITRTPTPTTPKPRVTKIPPIIPNLGFVEDTRKRRTTTGLFIPEVRRKGTFQQVGKPTSFFGAVEIGKRKVKETLGASLRVKEAKTGKIVPLKPFGIFAPSKRELGVLIQVKGSRLRLKSERREIQAARRNAKWWK